MPGAAVGTPSKSAFLDTNSLVLLLRYWQVCRDSGVVLSAVVDRQDLKSKIGNRVRLANNLPSREYDPIVQGMKCFKSLTAAKESYLFYTSELCQSELHHVVLSSIASERLTRQRVPHSLRVKRPQLLYRRALVASDYKALSAELEEFFLSLRVDHGISIAKVEDPATGLGISYQDVLDAAKELWSRVLIDVMDAYVFAAAIVIGADVFLTSDVVLKDALSKLEESTTSWGLAARSLQLALKGPDGPLPRARGPTDTLP